MSRRTASPSPEPLPLDAPVTALPGVSAARGCVLAESGIATLFDLLLLLPRRYEDRSRFAGIASLASGVPATVAGRIAKVLSKPNWYRKVAVHEVRVEDDSGSIVAVWFGQRWLGKALGEGARVVLFGAPTGDGAGRLRLENPEWELLADDAGEDGGLHVGRVVPIHPRVAPADAGKPIGGKLMRRLLRAAVDAIPPGLDDPLPDEIRRAHGWPGAAAALAEVHFPPRVPTDGDLPAPRETPAGERLAFEELLALQLRLAGERRRRLETERAPAVKGTLARLAPRAPFPLTAAQQRVLGEILADLASGHPMARLLQGDVGSGKTIVALLALALAAEKGFAGALMAPTAILAEQHAATVEKVLGSSVRWALLTGAVRGAERRRILAGVASGEIRLLLGTHALLEEPVEIPRLALAVVDEQHRFGVVHRERLRRKGGEAGIPHLLVMTATPIPRSLALTIHGDLEVSILDELPPGRRAVVSRVRGEEAREKVFAFVRERVAAGDRAMVVFPFIEESAKLAEVRALEAHAGEVRERLVGIPSVLVHGRQPAAERSEGMRRFGSGEAPLLLATTVIEVGVDVPEATVIVIENAERFGLSQLHQLRGRVGRSERPSWCILMAGRGAGAEALARLEAFARTASGFDVAEQDLAERGGGEIFGKRQSGRPPFRIADPATQLPLLVEARREAERIVAAGDGEAVGRRLAPWGFERAELLRG